VPYLGGGKTKKSSPEKKEKGRKGGEGYTAKQDAMQHETRKFQKRWKKSRGMTASGTPPVTGDKEDGRASEKSVMYSYILK